jgi:hypothetical protein
MSEDSHTSEIASDDTFGVVVSDGTVSRSLYPDGVVEHSRSSPGSDEQSICVPENVGSSLGAGLAGAAGTLTRVSFTARVRTPSFSRRQSCTGT